MKSIFLVKSPLQLLNAIEARHHFELNIDDCILIIMGDRKSQPQIMNLANALQEWGKIIILSHVGLFCGNPIADSRKNSSSIKIRQSRLLSKSFFNVRRLNRISQALGEVNYIFIGYIRYVYMKHFVNVTPNQHTVLLDDGNATIKLAEERKAGCLTNSPSGLKKKIKLLSKQLFQGIRLTEPKSLYFFTVYKIDVSEDDQVIIHNYNYIRKNVTTNGVTNEIYFLGSPLCQAGIITQDEYIKHLARVKSYYQKKNQRLVYIAHRREEPMILHEIEQTLGFKIIRFKYPIEYQLAFIGPRPAIIASFISSALDTCHLIFAKDLKLISFKLDLIKSPRKEEIEKLYMRYKSSLNENFIIVSDY